MRYQQRRQHRRRNPGAGVVALLGGIGALAGVAYLLGEQTLKKRLAEERQAYEDGKAGMPCSEGAAPGVPGRPAARYSGKTVGAVYLEVACQRGQLAAARERAEARAEARAAGSRSIVREVGESDASWEARKAAFRAEGGLASNVKVLSGLGGVLDGRDFGAYGRPMGKLLVRALWGVGLGIVGTGLGTSLVSALVTKPFGRFWGTTAGFATYTSGLGIVAYLAAGYAKEGLVLAGKAAGEALDKGDAPSGLLDKVQRALPDPVPEPAPAAPVSGYRGSYVWG